MSQSIYIVDLQSLNLRQPETVGEFWTLIEGQQGKSATVNPRYLALAHHIVERYPGPESPDSVWLRSPVQEAEKLKETIWHLELPAEERMAVTAHLVKQGNALGLALYDDQLGMAFLPSGAVIPEARQSEWECFVEELKNHQRPSKAQIRKKMHALFQQRLAPYGFVPLEGPVNSEVTYYRREVPDGWQRILIHIRELYGEYRCEARVAGCCQLVHAICEATLGRKNTLGVDIDYDFDPSDLEIPPGIWRIETEDQIRALFETVETKVLPCLDRIKDLEGLNWLHNHPDAYATVGRIVRKSRYTALICAYLMSDAGFAERAREFAERAEALAAKFPRDYANLPSELEQLLKYLRENVKPLR